MDDHHTVLHFVSPLQQLLNRNLDLIGITLLHSTQMTKELGYDFLSTIKRNLLTVISKIKLQREQKNVYSR